MFKVFGSERGEAIPLASCALVVCLDPSVVRRLGAGFFVAVMQWERDGRSAATAARTGCVPVARGEAEAEAGSPCLHFARAVPPLPACPCLLPACSRSSRFNLLFGYVIQRWYVDVYSLPTGGGQEVRVCGRARGPPNWLLLLLLLLQQLVRACVLPHRCLPRTAPPPQRLLLRLVLQSSNPRDAGLRALQAALELLQHRSDRRRRSSSAGGGGGGGQEGGRHVRVGPRVVSLYVRSPQELDKAEEGAGAGGAAAAAPPAAAAVAAVAATATGGGAAPAPSPELSVEALFGPGGLTPALGAQLLLQQGVSPAKSAGSGASGGGGSSSSSSSARDAFAHCGADALALYDSLFTRGGVEQAAWAPAEAAAAEDRRGRTPSRHRDDATAPGGGLVRASSMKGGKPHRPQQLQLQLLQQQQQRGEGKGPGEEKVSPARRPAVLLRRPSPLASSHAPAAAAPLPPALLARRLWRCCVLRLRLRQVRERRRRRRQHRRRRRRACPCALPELLLAGFTSAPLPAVAAAAAPAASSSSARPRAFPPPHLPPLPPPHPVLIPGSGPSPRRVARLAAAASRALPAPMPSSSHPSSSPPSFSHPSAPQAQRRPGTPMHHARSDCGSDAEGQENAARPPVQRTLKLGPEDALAEEGSEGFPVVGGSPGHCAMPSAAAAAGCAKSSPEQQAAAAAALWQACGARPNFQGAFPPPGGVAAAPAMAALAAPRPPPQTPPGSDACAQWQTGGREKDSDWPTQSGLRLARADYDSDHGYPRTAAAAAAAARAQASSLGLGASSLSSGFPRSPHVGLAVPAPVGLGSAIGSSLSSRSGGSSLAASLSGSGSIGPLAGQVGATPGTGSRGYIPTPLTRAVKRVQLVDPALAPTGRLPGQPLAAAGHWQHEPLGRLQAAAASSLSAPMSLEEEAVALAAAAAALGAGQEEALHVARATSVSGGPGAHAPPSSTLAAPLGHAAAAGGGAAADPAASLAAFFCVWPVTAAAFSGGGGTVAFLQKDLIAALKAPAAAAAAAVAQGLPPASVPLPVAPPLAPPPAWATKQAVKPWVLLALASLGADCVVGSVDGSRHAARVYTATVRAAALAAAGAAAPQAAAKSHDAARGAGGLELPALPLPVAMPPLPVRQ